MELRHLRYFAAVAEEPSGGHTPASVKVPSEREREILGGIRLRTVGLRLDKLFTCLNLRYRPLRFINFA
jgi:hypothetical protein